MVRANLHYHTVFSDGSQSPTDAVWNLIRHKVLFGAITDHDTTTGWETLLSKKRLSPFITSGEGYFDVGMIAAIELLPTGHYLRQLFRQSYDKVFGRRASREIKRGSFRIYHGIELTTAYTRRDGRNKGLHILGLGVNPPTRGVREHLELLAKSRQGRLYAMVEELNERDDGKYKKVRIPLVGPKGLQAIVGKSESPSRLHLGEVLRVNGYGTSARKCRDIYVNELEAAAFDYSKLYSVEEGIDVIRTQLGGVAGLAHPERTARDLDISIEELIAEISPYGIQFLDADSYNQVHRWVGLAGRHDLFITGGRDTHGKYDEGWREGPPYVDLPDRCIDSLEYAIKKAKRVECERPHD